MPAIRRRTPSALLAAVAVVAIVLAGVWVAGGVVSNDYRISMALTAVWFAFSGAACVLIARRRRALRFPVLAAYVVTAGAVGAYLGATTLRDDVVHERVITAAPSTTQRGDAPSEPAPVELARGGFRSHEHVTAGTARVIRDTDGRRYLTLTSFSTSPGPDLRVRLVPGGSFDGGTDGAVDLGALKGNRGDQQYVIPRGLDVGGHTVVIWCRAFSAPFGSAVLARTRTIRSTRLEAFMPEPDHQTLTDEEIETIPIGATAARVADDGDDTGDDAGDDSGDVSDTSDTGDDSGDDSGDDAA